MKIVSLDLERYGPFSGQILAFSPTAKLHIVYGPNEAGKSCSLAAVTDLFFGIDPRTRYDFLHEAKELRIGATIESRDGKRLAFQRRKGNKNTLLASSGSPLGDDALIPFLGSLTRDVFCHAFGLDREKLRAGAEEMLKSDGEVGASLFAAASGLRGLSDLRRTLDEEAIGIFDKRYSKVRTFYQAFDRFEAARKAIRELELKAGDWKARNEHIEELGAVLTQIKENRRQNAAEQARLSRLKRVAPLLRVIEGEKERLASLGGLPEVPASFIGRLRDGLGALAKAKEDCALAGSEHEQADRDLNEIIVDEALIAGAAEIERLFGETAAYSNDCRDMPRIQSEADDYSAALDQLAVRLGLRDAVQVEDRQPSDALQALARKLIGEGKTLDQILSTHRFSLESEAAALAKLEQQRTERGAPINPRPLNEKLAAFGPVLKRLEDRPDIERRLTAENRSLRQAALRLDPPVSDLDMLAKATPPSAAKVGRFRSEFDQVVDKVRRATEQDDAAAGAIAVVESKLKTLNVGTPVPSAEVIAAERSERDQAWFMLRGTLAGDAEALAGVTLADTIVSFETHKAEADRLADAATADAKRVADYSAETRRLKEEQGKQSAAKDKLQTLSDENRGLDGAWRAAWAPAGIAPLPPAEMAVWLTGAAALLERAEKRDALQDQIDRIDGAMRDITPALEAFADEIGLPRVTGLDAALLAQRIGEKLKVIASDWDAARDLETSIRDTQARIDQLRPDEQKVQGQLETWATKWHAAVAELGLAADTTVEEADAALLAWKEVPGTVRERDNRARRVAGMKRNIENFETQTKALAQRLAPDLLSVPPDTAVKTMAERLTAVRAAEARRVQAKKRLSEATRTQERAAAELEEAEAEIAALGESLPKGVDLSDLLARLAQRDELVTSLAERRNQLAAQGDGYGEDQLRAELSAFDPDQAEATLRELSVVDERLDLESQEKFAERDREVREVAALGQGVGAEVALQQRRNAEAELLEAAREWSILKLGAMLIGKVIDSHRASQQDPLMARAGALFIMLTGGAFAGIGQDFDEDDTPRIFGKRVSGEFVPVTGLSEGTRDQLYLALRLAYLEEYGGRAEAAPFIGDDLFTSFDEDRTANGLAALAAIGDRIQPILFTHHKHVVEIARKTIGSGLSVIDLS